MAGHSKWANIKHRKGAQDAKRGKIFTKLIREITVSARICADPGSNPRLRLVIDKALAVNMPRDTIDRAIKRGAGGDNADQMEDIRYEGYGPGGVAVMVDCLSDNRNRTVGEVRHAFTKCGGNLGSDGSVAFQFKKCGILRFKEDVLEDPLTEIALECDALEILKQEEGWEVQVEPDRVSEASGVFQAKKIMPTEAMVTYVPSNEVKVTDEDTAKQLMKMIEMLEDLDDVQEVYFNADVDEALLERLG